MYIYMYMYVYPYPYVYIYGYIYMYTKNSAAAKQSIRRASIDLGLTHASISCVGAYHRTGTCCRGY